MRRVSFHNSASIARPAIFTRSDEGYIAARYPAILRNVDEFFQIEHRVSDFFPDRLVFEDVGSGDLVQ